MPRGGGEKGGQRHICGTESFQLESLGERENFWGQQVQQHQQHPTSKRFLGAHHGQASGCFPYRHMLTEALQTLWTGVTFPHPCFMDEDAEMQRD